MMDNNQTNAVDTNTANEREENTVKNDEKKFSQSELDEIIKKRLERERGKAKAGESHEADLMTREKALVERETKLACKEILLDSGMDLSFIDVLDTSDVEKFKEQLGTVYALIQEEGRKTRQAPPLRNPEAECYDTSVNLKKLREKRRPKGKYY